MVVAVKDIFCSHIWAGYLPSRPPQHRTVLYDALSEVFRPSLRILVLLDMRIAIVLGGFMKLFDS
jgi:hypothetical protein